jgi:hypothetical protein
MNLLKSSNNLEMHIWPKNFGIFIIVQMIAEFVQRNSMIIKLFQQAVMHVSGKEKSLTMIILKGIHWSSSFRLQFQKKNQLLHTSIVPLFVKI